MFQIAVLFSIFSYILALPSGSPICRMNSHFTHHHGEADTSAPFDAKAVVDKNLTAKVTITGDFKGLLLYVNKANTESNVGTFDGSDKFQFVDACDPATKSTLTHKDDSVKNGATFVWTAPEAGSYVVTALVTGGRVPWNQYTINLDVAAEAKEEVKPVVAENKVEEKVKVVPEKQAENKTKTASKPKRRCREKGTIKLNRKLFDYFVVFLLNNPNLI